MKRIAFFLFLVNVVGCQSALELDENETGSMHVPKVGFDPANKIIPLPNNLLKDPETGKVNLPTLCGETPTTKGLRENILNQLDGFGTFKYPLTTTFSEAVDPASLEGNILLYKVGSTDGPIPVTVTPTTLTQWTPDCSSSKYVPGIAITAQGPLDESSTYVVALKNGIKTLNGEQFNTSLTWALVRQPTAPVVAEYTDGVATRITTNYTALDPQKEAEFTQLAGIDLLWRAHSEPLEYLSSQIANYDHREILLAWSFDTLTIRKPFDPNNPESLVNKLDEIAANLNVTTIMTGDDAVAHYQEDFDTFWKFTENSTATSILPFTCDQNADDTQFITLPCDGVGKIIKGTFLSPNYQYDIAEGNGMSPGPWMDPINPPLLGEISRIPFLALIPASPPPAEGYPVIIWGHGINRSKEQMYRFAARVVNEGFIMIAFDWAKHGERAARISTDASSGCSDADVYGYNGGAAHPVHGHRVGQTSKDCYAKILSPVVPSVRDTLRQSQLDSFQFVRAIKNCAGSACNADFNFNTDRLGYMAHSLGVLISMPFVAYQTDIKTALFSAASSGWVDVLLNSPNPQFICDIVDGLIGLEVIEGTTTEEGGANATCMTGGYTTQPSFWQFIGTGRWILDLAESTNFLELIKPRVENEDMVISIFQMCDDEAIPQIGTQNLATGLGLANASCDAPNSNTADNTNVSEILAEKKSAWLTYQSSDTKSYYHDVMTQPSIDLEYYVNGELMVPATGSRGIQGAYQVQKDVVEFFKQNL